jgi:translation initiation factor IF-1
MNIRRFKQIGVVHSTGGTLPKFRKPYPEISPGDVVVFKYTDDSHDKVLVQPPPENESRCTLCAYGSRSSRCPVRNDAFGVSCMFDIGYAVSVDNVLEEL